MILRWLAEGRTYLISHYTWPLNLSRVRLLIHANPANSWQQILKADDFGMPPFVRGPAPRAEVLEDQKGETD